MDVLIAAAAEIDREHTTPEPDHSRCSIFERCSIVALHRIGKSNTFIADHLNISRNTVQHWIEHFAECENVKSAKRRGRPRITDEATDTAIAFTAYVDVFTSPRQVKRKLELTDVSARTVDRRLQEVGLFGRVAGTLLSSGIYFTITTRSFVQMLSNK